jgi:hypothetical protein
VGNWSDDRVYWGRPEDVNLNRTTRPVFTVNINSPGADVVAQTAAALAAASLVLDAVDEAGSEYQAKLVRHAKWLYGLAKQVIRGGGSMGQRAIWRWVRAPAFLPRLQRPAPHGLALG